VDDILEYDYLKTKPYDTRTLQGEEGKKYILSFSDKHHIKVSEAAKEIIDLFDGNHTLFDIQCILQDKGMEINESELKKIVQDVLIDNGILEGSTFKNKKGNSMLWIKIPLIDSCRLNNIFSILKYAFEKKVLFINMICLVVCAVASIYMILHMENEKPLNSILIMAIGYFSLIIHEFGHASAAYKYKINVGKIGVGMYFLYPVMYIDMTSAWRLPSKQRVILDAGGMYFQALTIIPLTIIGFISQESLFFICSIYVLAMSVYNLLPFLKLDGYWLFCDYFELNNLSQNAFKIVKAQIVNRNNKISKRKKMYYIFSIVYASSIIFMFIIGIIYSITTIRNWEYVVEIGRKIIYTIHSGNFQAVFRYINSILIYILPLIFMVVMLIKGLVRYVMEKKETQNKADIA
jgi:putative peptide zinc metalloprotease protein